MILAAKCARRCETCGKPIEVERADWAVPLCFACVPPVSPKFVQQWGLADDDPEGEP